jgi:hypothetical protein
MAAATEDKKHLSSVADADADDETTRLANELPDDEKEPDDSKSIEALAEEPTPTPPMQIAIPGTFGNISLAAGGTPPTSSEVRLMGGRLPVEGQFHKGEIITLLVQAKVGEVAFIDTTDDWGNVQKTVRAHKARMLSVTRRDAP